MNWTALSIIIIILFVFLIQCAVDLFKTIYTGDKAEKIAKNLGDKISREVELKVKRDFKRGIFD